MTASLVPVLLMTAATLGGTPRGVVLDFSATWCGPCQQMNPIVSRLERQGYSIRKVDVDQERELADRFNISSIPAFVLVVDGKEVTRITGATSEEQLKRLLAQIPSDPPPVAATPPRRSPSAGDTLVDLGEATHPPMSGGFGDRDPSAAAPTAAPPVHVAETSAEPVKPGNFFGRLLGRKKEPAPAASREPKVIRGLDEDASATINLLPVRNPMAASVRVHVTINGQTSVGSGTAIDSRIGRTIVATCGHLFSGWNEQSKVEIDVFTETGIKKYVGRMVTYDSDADVGIVAINTDQIIATAQVPDAQGRPQTGHEVVNIGCSGGAAPTQEAAQVTALNYFEGPDNIECTGVPVQGRSGGGLFNRDGQLVGICIGADSQRQRGAYAGLLAIHDQLDAARLTDLYRSSASPSNAHESHPKAHGSHPVGTNPDDPDPRDVTRGLLATNESAATESIPDQPAFEEMDNATAAALADVSDAEVICIIRDRRQPEAPSRVVIIDRASPKFMSYLGGEVSNTAMTSPPSAVQTRRMTQPATPVPTQLADPQTMFRPAGSSRPLFTTPGQPHRGEHSRSQTLQPTALESPFVPQLYVRSPSTRR